MPLIFNDITEYLITLKSINYETRKKTTDAHRKELVIMQMLWERGPSLCVRWSTSTKSPNLTSTPFDHRQNPRREGSCEPRSFWSDLPLLCHRQEGRFHEAFVGPSGEGLFQQFLQERSSALVEEEKMSDEELREVMDLIERKNAKK